MPHPAPERHRRRTLVLVAAAMAISLTARADHGGPWHVVARLSVGADGTEANGESQAPLLSPNGRFVVFSSRADNLVPGDTNGERDAFFLDRRTGEIERVSVASDGTEANGDSVAFGVSGNGRLVSFSSRASNLFPGDVNGDTDVFVYDRRTRRTTLVSVASDGTPGNAFSFGGTMTPDGRFLAFQSAATNLVAGDTNGVRDVFIHDRLIGGTARVSVASDGTQGDRHSLDRSVSSDGRFVAFFSEASTLVPGDTNGASDVFVHDRLSGQTTRVSVASDGSQANARSGFGLSVVSADGRFVVFPSLAANLVDGDTNGAWDVFLHDRRTGRTTRVNVASDGAPSAGDPDGSGVFPFPSISPDGRFVLFQSKASDLVEGDTNGAVDLFVHDRRTGRTDLVSVAADGTQGDGDSQIGAISRHGRVVAMASLAANLIPGDMNGVRDVFIATRGPGHSHAAADGEDEEEDEDRHP